MRKLPFFITYCLMYEAGSIGAHAKVQQMPATIRYTYLSLRDLAMPVGLT